MFYEVRELILKNHPSEACDVIRLAFADIAEEFHLTPQNCQNHPSFLTDTAILDSLLRPAVICFGAFADNALVGFAAIWPKRHDAYELTRLCVLPEHRHAGLGGQLLQAAVQAAKECGARKIEIGTIEANERLKRWYESHGFRATAVKSYKHLPFRVCEMEQSL